MNVITDDFSKEPTNDHPKSTLKLELKISDLIVYKQFLKVGIIFWSFDTEKVSGRKKNTMIAAGKDKEYNKNGQFHEMSARKPAIGGMERTEIPWKEPRSPCAVAPLDPLYKSPIIVILRGLKLANPIP